MTNIDVHHQNLIAVLGKPLHEERICADEAGRFRTYQHGSIYYHPDIGAFETHGAIYDYWKRMGCEDSFLGYPVSDECDYSTTDYIISVLGDPYDIEAPEFKILGRCSIFQGGCIVCWNDLNIPNNHQPITVFKRPDGPGIWVPMRITFT